MAYFGEKKIMFFTILSTYTAKVDITSHVREINGLRNKQKNMLNISKYIATSNTFATLSKTKNKV